MLRTVTRAGLVLDLFSVERPEWGATAVARELDIAKSQAHELLVSLSDIGLLERVRAGRYRLGWRIVALGSLLFDATGLREAAVPAMESLAARCGETVELAVWGHGRPVCIASVAGTRPDAVAPRAHGDGPVAHASAIGKVLLSARPAGELRDLLDEAPALTQELTAVRTRGFAVEDTGRERASGSVAAPVLHRRGRTVAALGLSVAAPRWRPRCVEYTRALLHAAADVSRRVGRHDPGARSPVPNSRTAR